MRSYLALLDDVMANGVDRGDRTGTGTRSVFGRQLRFDLQEGFPMLTTKRIHVKSFVIELLWFISGNTNTKFLTDNGVTIWDEWSDENGDLGPIYGKQWRRWMSPAKIGDWEGIIEVDQLVEVIEAIKESPESRRLLVSAWNPGEMDSMKLPPCHFSYQFYVEGGKLSCMFNMRSTDVFLGLPFNIASYALLTHMVAQQCDLEVGELIWSGGDVHIYHNHFDQVNIQRERKPYQPPQLVIKRKPDSIDGYVFEDFEFVDYQHHPGIKAPVAK
ncbi:Thymidylate synthase [compost metagenome]